MDKGNSYKKYSGQLFERYRKGELSPKEAHALEKASLADPLLADALEGFNSSSRSSEPELIFLTQWVNERVEESQAAIRFIPKRRSYAPLMKVAAVVLLVVGATWMGYFFWVGPSQPRLADAGSSKSVSDQSAPIREAISANPIRTEVSATPPPAAANPVQEVVVAPVELIKEASSTDVAKPSVSDPGRSVAPVSQADAATAAPLQGEQEIIQEKIKQGLTESNQAESASVNTSTKRLTADAPSKSMEAPSPAVGWTSFEAYLERNRITAPTPSNTITTHLVELSFEIGKDGRPTDIKVERSAGSFYDDKAIELLKKGPGWIPAKSGKRAELLVRF